MSYFIIFLPQLGAGSGKSLLIQILQASEEQVPECLPAVYPEQVIPFIPSSLQLLLSLKMLL